MVSPMKNTRYYICLYGLFFFFWGCKKEEICSVSESEEPIHGINKINGLSYEAPESSVDSSAFVSVKSIGANWLALMPFGFTSQNSPMIAYNLPFLYWGETRAGLEECIRLAREQHQSVMLKPQLWISGGSYTGHHGYSDTSDWLIFESQYLNFMLFYARFADSLDLEMLCIGTELENFVEQRPQFWTVLVDTIRTVYSGKLTYAANWDAYKDFPLWQKLDYIGIDGYFPLSSSITPSVSELLVGWDPTINQLEEYYAQIGKPILFTEYGYRSMDACAQTPWDHQQSNGVNQQAQANSYEAFFEKLYRKSWFAGGFLWKWHADPTAGIPANDYTPQNKLAQDVIQTYFTKP
jgi:hypothetical protein